MVEYAEFEDYMASQIGDPITQEDTGNYFKTFDTTGEGFTIGDKSYSKKEIDDTIAEADVNSDLQVSDEGMTMSWGLDQGNVELSHSRPSAFPNDGNRHGISVTNLTIASSATHVFLHRNLFRKNELYSQHLKSQEVLKVTV